MANPTAENLFPSSTSATSSISSGTAGSGILDSSGTPEAVGARPPSDILNRVVQGAHHTIDRLAETAAPHVQRLEQGVTTASDTLHARADQARDVGDEWAESVRSTVRENPLAAVATALAVGLLIARITR